MIEPRRKKIDTTQGECVIRPMRAREQKALWAMQVESMKTESEADRLELTGRMQDALMACCDLPADKLMELEAWEVKRITDEIVSLASEDMTKN